MLSRSTAPIAALLIVTVGFGLFAFEHYGTAVRERGAQKGLAAAFAITAAQPHAPVRLDRGHGIALLSLPTIRVNGVAVVEGATLDDLRRGPVHDSASSMPGEGGAVVIVGHRRTYGGPFRRLGQLRTGDVISVRTINGLYFYRVSGSPRTLGTGTGTSLQLPPVHVPLATSGASGLAGQFLVLATAEDASGGRLKVVVATLDGARLTTGVGPAGPGSPAATGVVAKIPSVPGQRIGLLFILGWLLILGCTVPLVRRFRRRFPSRLVYAAGSLIAVIGIYQVYLAVDRLLPGTY